MKSIYFMSAMLVGLPAFAACEGEVPESDLGANVETARQELRQRGNRPSSDFYTSYTIDPNIGRLFKDLAKIDKDTGLAVAGPEIDLSNSDGVGLPAVLGLSIDPRDGTMYSFVNWVFGPSTQSELVTIDPDTGATTRLGDMHDMNFAGSETDTCGNFYTVGFSGGYPDGPEVFFGDAQLYRFNTDTGEATVIGDTGIEDMMDLAFDKQGVLWGTTMNKLFTIDVETGESTFVTDIVGVPTEGQPRNMVMSIDFDRRNRLYGSTTEAWLPVFAESAFMRINHHTGQVSLVSESNGLGAVHGGEFAPDFGRICYAGHEVPVPMRFVQSLLDWGATLPSGVGSDCGCH
tara:strand:- start:9076 stop:10113 length:1038 start_codon:yes stop_codon:yes gene_type:complete